MTIEAPQSTAAPGLGGDPDRRARPDHARVRHRRPGSSSSSWRRRSWPGTTGSPPRSASSSSSCWAADDDRPRLATRPPALRAGRGDGRGGPRRAARARPGPAGGRRLRPARAHPARGRRGGRGRRAPGGGRRRRRTAPSVRERIATELRDGGIDPARARVTVEPAVAGWGEPIRVTVAIDAQASIPFLGSWPVPLNAEFVTRSEVTH